MIAHIEGRLAQVETESVIVDIHGFGLRVFTPITEELVRVGVGSRIRLFTYLHVREDAMQLYGFLHTEELDLFKKLINVSSVGAKTAMGILTHLPIGELLLSISGGDAKRLSKAPGVGAKTAGRIILELKDKVGVIPLPAGSEGEGIVAGSSQTGPLSEAVLALLSLGYSQSEAEGAVRQVAAPEMSVEEILKQCLKVL